jgi:hypothetical protein
LQITPGDIDFVLIFCLHLWLPENCNENLN